MSVVVSRGRYFVSVDIHPGVLRQEIPRAEIMILISALGVLMNSQSIDDPQTSSRAFRDHIEALHHLAKESRNEDCFLRSS